MTPSSLNLEHEKCRDVARRLFTAVPKMGGEVFSEEYLLRLDSEIEIVYDSLMRHNAAKNVFTGMRTPTVLACIAAALYIISGVLGMIGLLSLANFANLALFSVIAVSAFWIYARFSGNYADVATQIDVFANTLFKVSTFCFIQVFVAAFWPMYFGELFVLAVSQFLLCVMNCAVSYLITLPELYFHA